MFWLLSLLIAVGLTGFVVPAALPTFGNVVAGVALGVGAAAVTAWNFLWRFISAVCWVVTIWLALLIASILTGSDWFMGIAFLIGIVCFTLAMLALALTRKALEEMQTLLESLGGFITHHLPITNEWIKSLNWFKKGLLSPLYGLYLIVALPITATAEVIRAVGAARDLPGLVLSLAIRILAGINVSLWFITLLITLQSQHGLRIVNSVSIGMLFATLAVFISLGFLGAGKFKNGTAAFLGTLGGGSLVLIGLITFHSWMPALCGGVAQNLQNTYDWAALLFNGAGSKTQTTGRMYYQISGKTTLIPCSMDNLGNVISVRTALAESGEPGTLLMAANPYGFAITFNGILWIPVYKTWGKEIRNGFNESQVYLAFKDDLSYSPTLPTGQTQNQSSWELPSIGLSSSYPWYYYAIPLLVLIFLGTAGVVQQIPWKILRLGVACLLVLAGIWLAIRGADSLSVAYANAKNSAGIGPSYQTGSLKPVNLPANAQPFIAAAAAQHGVDAALISAVCMQESGCNLNAPDGGSGEIGPMQIMPDTGSLYDVTPVQLRDPAINVDTGARILRAYVDRFPGRLDLVALAYNAGPEKAEKYRNVAWSQINPAELRGVNSRGVQYDSYAYVTEVLNFNSVPTAGQTYQLPMFASLPTPRPQVNVAADGTGTVAVPANVLPAAGPEITIPAGTYTVTASGTVNSTPNPADGAHREVGPEGWDQLPAFLVGRPLLIDDAPFMSAVAILREDGRVTMIKIGKGSRFSVSKETKVRFAFNDTIREAPASYLDNVGNATFKISRDS